MAVSGSADLQIATVLFLDIVRFSVQRMERQKELISLLQETVRDAHQYQQAVAKKRLISLPTGDGMALVFLNDTGIRAVKCALEINAALRSHPGLELRMGVHVGPIYQHVDIKEQINVVGSAINIAQRVMDCGDAGHILVTRSVAEVLEQFSEWQGYLHALGEFEVKHGVKIHATNLYKESEGNPQVPGKLAARAIKQAPVPPPRATTRRRLPWIGIAVLLLIGAFLGYSVRFLRRQQGGNPVASKSSSSPRRSIAVIGFKNVSGRTESAWISTAVSEMLTTELEVGEKIRTIPGESVARVKIELDLPDMDSFSHATLAKLRRNLRTDLVVVGSYITLNDRPGGQIRLDLRLQDTKDGETVAAVSETGTEDDLFQLVSHGGMRLREKLGIGTVSSSQAGSVRAILPSNPEAAKFYSEGLVKMRTFDALAARELLEKAVGADPKHALAHSELAGAWAALGYDAKAQEESRKAFELAASLSREDRLSLEGRHWQILKNWEKAVETYRMLFGSFPDNLEYGLRLCAVQTAAGQGQAALATTEMLRNLPLPASEDPRIDLEEAAAAQSVSDFKREQAAASRAAEKGSAQGALLLLARARILEARALWELADATRSMAAAEEAKQIFAASRDKAGVASAFLAIGSASSRQKELVKAKKAHEEGLAIYRQIGDNRGMANALNNIAAVLSDMGDLEQAKAAFGGALAIRREIADKSGVAVALSNIASVLLNQGDLEAAKKNFYESLAISKEIGERRSAVRAMTNLGILFKDQGDLTAAKALLRESLPIRRELGDKRGLALCLQNLGLVLALQGDLTEGAKMQNESLTVAREIGDQRVIAFGLAWLADVQKLQGDSAGARKNYEEALAIRDQRGEKATAADTRIAMAELDLDDGRYREAEALAKAGAEEFLREKAEFATAQGIVIVAASLLARGRIADAKREIDHAGALLSNSDYLYTRLSYGIVRARIEAASGKTDEATKFVEAVIAEADKHGLPGYQLEARLAFGQIELAGGKSSAARDHLASLEREAKSKGYGLIARKAAKANRQP